MENKIAVEVKAVCAGYTGRVVLREVSLKISMGESVALIGPNGCGKSTLLKTIAGFIKPNAGEIALDGVRVVRESPDERVRKGLGYLPQTRNVFADLTVAENLRLAWSVGDPTQGQARVAALLEAFPILRDKLNRRAGLLSGGQRQALAVAMTLVRPTKLLLLDDPVAGLSQATGASLLAAVRAFQGREGFAMVIVEHRLRLIHPVIDRVVVMREGQVVDDTPTPDQILNFAWLAGHYRVRT
jgi:ABC-type branched-subunit amino acid transport system ATPase component